MSKKEKSTSWEEVEPWYSSLVGEKGHYYHQSVILPGVLRLLNISKNNPRSLLDLGCGQGVLARSLPDASIYWGVDASKSLILAAKKMTRRPNSQFCVADVTKHLSIAKNDFECACFILSLQNIEHPEEAIAVARNHLRPGGELLLVLNHPCFRIPRQSSWEIDATHQMQYRRINRYLSPMKIPIQMHTKDKGLSQTTFSFHYPLSSYMNFLAKNDLSVITMEEWISDKQSTGSCAKRENRARNEIPLFLAILANNSRRQVI